MSHHQREVFYTGLNGASLDNRIKSLVSETRFAVNSISTSTPTSRVVIVGGGIIGCATAYYLTRAGVSDVVVVERDHVASGASGYSAGILTPYSGSNDPGLLALSAASLALHADLAEVLPDITGIDYGYDLKPYLRCAFGEVGHEDARRFLDGRRSEGLVAEWLSGNEAREACDWLSDEVEGACLTEIEPTVDSRLLTRSLLDASKAMGVELKLAEVTSISEQGVELSDGSDIGADAVVLAMGPWTNLAGQWLGYEVPVVPQKGELLYMHLPAEEAGDAEQDRPSATMHNMDDGGVILTRRLSRTVLGATKEDGRGYDRDLSRYAWDFILPRVRRLTDRISESDVTNHTACLRPMPADGKPYVGQAPGCENIYIASGHWSEGVHYAPLTGKAIADLIATGSTETDITAVSASRLSGVFEA